MGRVDAGPRPRPLTPPNLGGGGFPGFPGFGGGGLPMLPVPGAPGYSGTGAPLPTNQNGGGFGAPPAFSTGGGFGAAPSFTNTADPSKNLTWLEEQYKARLTADPTKRATEKAVGAIRDLAEGQNKQITGNLARRGMVGTGIDTGLRQNLAGEVQKAGARAASDIALGREKDLDQMVLSGLPIMGAQDQLGLQNKRLGLDQYGIQQQGNIAQAQLQMQQQQMAMQQQQAAANLWATYMGMFR